MDTLCNTITQQKLNCLNKVNRRSLMTSLWCLALFPTQISARSVASYRALKFGYFVKHTQERITVDSVIRDYALRSMEFASMEKF